MKKSLITLFILSNIIYANHTYDHNENLDDLSLEELMNIKIYSATKSYQRIEEIPANITVLTRKDIEKYNYTTLDELLKHIPGLFIIDDTEHFQIGSRGSLGSSFKLMINNNPISPLRVPTGAMSNRNFFATPVESIDRIEIIKGPQAVTYGSNSMYGSINIITNDFNEKNIVSISRGNNGQSKVFARVNSKQKDGGFTLNTSFYETDGISGNLEDSFTNEDLNKYSNDKISLNKLLKNEYNTIDFSHRYKNLTTDITYSQTNYGFYTFPTYRNNNVTQIEKALAITYEDEINDELSYKTNFITSKKNYNIDDISTNNFINYGYSNFVEDNRNQLDLHFNYKINQKINLMMGTTYKNFNEKALLTVETPINAAKIDFKYKLKEIDFYSKFQYKYTDSFELNAGVRHSKKNKSSIPYNVLQFPSNTYINREPSIIYKKNDYLPEFSAIYHLNSNNHLKFLFGKANQLTYSSINNYEEINSSEINYLHIAKNYQINSSIFYNEAKNINLFTQEGTTSATSDKGDRITKGAEFAIIYKPNHNFELNSSITVQDTKNKLTNTSENYKPDFSPKLLGKLNLSYILDSTRYSLIFDYISKMKAPYDIKNNNRIGKDSNHNMNIGMNINHKFNDKLSLNLNVNNILNRDNRIPAGSTLTKFYNGAFTKNREFLLTLKYRF